MGMFSGGSDMAAASYRQHAQSVMQAAQFNIGVLRWNTARDLEGIAKTIPRAVSQQRAQAAHSGFNVNSKSFRMINHETVDELLSKAEDMRKATELQAQAMYYDAQVQATNLENRARLSEQQGAFQQQQGITRVFQTLLGGFS